MFDFLYIELFAGILVWELGLVVALVLVGPRLIRELFVRKKKTEHHRQATCHACGWQGRVSKYARRCPKCNEDVYLDE